MVGDKRFEVKDPPHKTYVFQGTALTVSIEHVPEKCTNRYPAYVPSNELQLFDFNSNNIRVIDIDGAPWFPAKKDVCDVLGLSQPSNFTTCLRDTEVTTVLKSAISNPYSTGVMFQTW